jgi:hypothetical protein
MISFNQKLDSYRPLNNIKKIPEVDIIKSLDVIIVNLDFYH